MTDHQRAVQLAIINNPNKCIKQIALENGFKYECTYYNKKLLMPGGKPK